MASVIIHGFKTEAAAKEFISWYEGQGEQDIGIWWECREDEGKDIGKQPTVDMKASYPLIKDENENFVVHVRN